MDATIWSQIKRLKLVENLSNSEIARQLGVNRKTVRRALEQNVLPKRKAYAPRPSKLDPYKAYLGKRLELYPHLSGAVLFEELKRQGYSGKINILGDYLSLVRHRQKEAFLRIETMPGEFAQVDWANCGTVQIGNAKRNLSCFVMVLSYSRMLYLEFTLSQCLEDFLRCHIQAFQFFGGVPRRILYDNLKSVVLSRLAKTVQFNPKFMEFSGIYLFEPVACNPRRGNEKGKVENGIKYVRGSFLSARTIAWPAVNSEATHWRDTVANCRIHGTTRELPLNRFLKEKKILAPIPGETYDCAIFRSLKATSQALVHFDGNSYSVPYRFAYKPVLLKAYKDEVHIWNDAEELACHRRSFERGVVVEDPKHYEGLLAEKKKAFASKLEQQFLALGDLAHEYLEGLFANELNAAHHVREIMECVRRYDKTEVLQALDHSLSHKAFGAAYLKNIILQQRSRRGIEEDLPLTIPQRPYWNQISVEEQDLSLYDDLFDSDANLKPKKEEPLT